MLVLGISSNTVYVHAERVLKHKPVICTCSLSSLNNSEEHAAAWSELSKWCVMMEVVRMAGLLSLSCVGSTILQRYTSPLLSRSEAQYSGPPAEGCDIVPKGRWWSDRVLWWGRGGNYTVWGHTLCLSIINTESYDDSSILVQLETLEWQATYSIVNINFPAQNDDYISSYNR